MSPYQKLEAEYLKHPKEKPFEDYVRWHLRHGFVFSRPDFFAMGMPVYKDAPRENILDPDFKMEGKEQDCWFIHAAAGNTARIWQIVPFPLPWFCWMRLHDPLASLTFVESDRLKRLCPPALQHEHLFA